MNVQEITFKLKVDTSEIDAAIEKYHVHKWVLDTSGVDWLGETYCIYHCDAHDPPLVRKALVTYGPT